MDKQVDIEVLKTEIRNMKETNLQSSVQNTADHLEIKSSLNTINLKLDKEIESKAEKTDLQTLDNRIWYLVIGFLMLLAGIIATWFKK